MMMMILNYDHDGWIFVCLITLKFVMCTYV